MDKHTAKQKIIHSGLQINNSCKQKKTITKNYSHEAGSF